MESLSGINTPSQIGAAPQGARSAVVAAIRSASVKSGVDFAYLLNKAQRESDLNPKAKAAGSSASGLYQFIDQTWLKTVKESGAKYGLAAQADKIDIGADGVARIASAADKKAILALRFDPEIASGMAAELAKANKDSLQKSVGGSIGPTEMYMAHFLGSGGAAKFLNAMKCDPDASAASLLPDAAAVNKGVFYDAQTGRARSVGEIYGRFAAKFDQETLAPENSARVAEASSGTQGGTTMVAHTLSFALASSGAGDRGSGTGAGFAPPLSSIGDSSIGAMMLSQMEMETLGLEAIEKVYRSEALGYARSLSSQSFFDQVV